MIVVWLRVCDQKIILWGIFTSTNHDKYTFLSSTGVAMKYGSSLLLSLFFSFCSYAMEQEQQDDSKPVVRTSDSDLDKVLKLIRQERNNSENIVIDADMEQVITNLAGTYNADFTFNRIAQGRVYFKIVEAGDKKNILVLNFQEEEKRKENNRCFNVALTIEFFTKPIAVADGIKCVGFSKQWGIHHSAKYFALRENITDIDVSGNRPNLIRFQFKLKEGALISFVIQKEIIHNSDAGQELFLDDRVEMTNIVKITKTDDWNF